MAESSIQENPFTPTFGEVPAHMAGRAMLLNELERAFKSSKRHPNLTTAITGARGTGKTALLSLAAERAEQCGWVAVRTIAIPGMLDDILISTRRAASHLIDSAAGARLSGVEVGQFIGAEWDNPDVPTNWRSRITDVLEQLDRTETGLLIVVDEVQPKLAEMIELVAVYQLLVMEGRRVALLMAGLPHNMLALESDKTVSFLRRAQQFRLGRIPDYEVADAMRNTIEDAGRSIAAPALDQAVAAADGFPFMMQLVGFRMWDQHKDHGEITEEDVRNGVVLASAELKERIVKTTYGGLSKGDKAFLRAMVEEGDQAITADIAKRMGKAHSYATQYKNRLLGQGVIEETPAGLSFQLPLMREYVTEVEGLDA